MTAESCVEFIKSEVALPEDSFGEPILGPAFYQSGNQEQFEAYAKNPENWYNKSKELQLCANFIFGEAEKALNVILSSIPEVIFQERFLTPQEEQAKLEMKLGSLYFQLSGSSIENLLKGIFIAKYPEEVIEEGQLSRKITTHNLTALLKSAELTNPFQDKNWTWSKELPNKLTRYIVWQGRYPVPTKFDNDTFEGKFVYKGQSDYKKENPFDSLKADLPMCAPSDKEDIDSFYRWLWEQRPSN
jgi:hypothetical protein